MSDKLKIGDKVKINNKYGLALKYCYCIFEMASKPQYDTGHECVKLKGTRGVWRTDGLTLIRRNNSGMEDKLFKFILKCCRNHNKPDIHSFFINIKGGRAFVDCRQYEVVITSYFDDTEPIKWCGTPVAAANRLKMLKADINAIDM